MTDVIELNYKPHDKQKLFHKSNARWRILNCGRRWGKTQCAVAEGARLSFTKPNQRGWIVAPTYPLSQEDIRTLRGIIPYQLIKQELKAERKFILVNGSEIDFKSADNEAALRGAGLDWVILDEAARIKQNSWEALRPALSDKQGRGIFMSTPKGKNWFYRLYLLGKENKADYESWHFPSITNPYFPKAEWDIVKENYPADMFSQEYQANFLDDAAAVFRNIDKAVKGEYSKPVAGQVYFAGIDLARTQDFTVIVVLDENKHVVFFDRFNRLDWQVQKERILKVLRSYNHAFCLIDSTGVGDPITEELQSQYDNIGGYKFSNESKSNIVTSLQVAFEKEELSFPENEILVDELQAYEYELLPSGRVRYNAPENYHDDTVVALALANWCKNYTMVPDFEDDISFR